LRKYLLVLLGAWFLIAAGCAHYRQNAPLARYDAKAGYRFENVSPGENSDSLFVILAFSGGGTRAAALAYGVLEKLRAAPIRWDGRARRLLDEVDVISSVSGGSFAAAYYALFGEETFSEFRPVFLYRDVQGELFARLFYPANWFRLLSPTFDRIDMAAEYYNAEIFRGRTFGDLLRLNRRPYIILNATDMTLGDRFEFTQRQFDPICSDLAGQPVARAVAASSAFPGLLSPITLKNYAGTCGYTEPLWVANALDERDVTSRSFLNAGHRASYRDRDSRRYLHLLDGGVADNIGLRAPILALMTNQGPWDLLAMINRKLVRKVVVIVVNAKNAPDTALDKRERSPGLTSVLSAVANAPMDNYSFDTIEQLLNGIKDWKGDDLAYRHCAEKIREACPGAKLPPPPQPVEFYPVVVSFDSLKEDGERAYFKNLPTTFALPREAVDRLVEVGGRLLDASPEYRRLLGDLQ
jgi:NTE family protein